MKPIHLFFAVLILAFGLIFFATKSDAPDITINYDSFNQCLADAGATFYGAFWCPHCQEQKRLLDNNEYIPYVECSTPDGEGQLQVCADENITGYPTWKFADGSTLSGSQSLETLAATTNCALE